MTIKTTDGQDQKVQLTPNEAIGVVEKATLADVKQGGYVGTAATAQSDGSLRAVEVHIFADAQRGVGEGFNPNFAPVPNSSMTNATVTSSVDSIDGRTLMLTYNGGEKKVVIAPNTLIVRLAVGDLSDLKAGQQVAVNAQKLPDGSLQASRVQVGRDGATLPF